MQEAHAEANKTPLYHWHLAHGANMVTFCGLEHAAMVSIGRSSGASD